MFFPQEHYCRQKTQGLMVSSCFLHFTKAMVFAGSKPRAPTRSRFPAGSSGGSRFFQIKSTENPWKSQPIGSMYGIYANIGGIWMVNVTIYSIHGSYGQWFSFTFGWIVKYDIVVTENWRIKFKWVTYQFQGSQTITIPTLRTSLSHTGIYIYIYHRSSYIPSYPH